MFYKITFDTHWSLSEQAKQVRWRGRKYAMKLFFLSGARVESGMGYNGLIWDEDEDEDDETGGRGEKEREREGDWMKAEQMKVRMCVYVGVEKYPRASNSEQ